MSYSQVKAYRKTDGTFVRAHKRKTLLRKIFRQSVGPKNHLLSLVDVDPKSIPKQLSPSEIKTIVKKETYQNSKWGEYKLDLENMHFPQIASFAMGAGGVAGIGALLTWGTAAALPLIPFFAIPFLTYVGATKISNAMARKRARKNETVLQTSISPEILDGVASKTNWVPAEEYRGNNRFKKSKWHRGLVRSKVSDSQWGEVRWKEKEPTGNSLLNIKDVISGKTFFFPGVDLSGNKFKFPIVLPGVNLEGANLSKTAFTECNFNGANFEEANLESAVVADETSVIVDTKRSLRNANFRNANLVNSYFGDCDLVGADFTGANLSRAKLPYDLRGIKLGNREFEMLIENMDTILYEYDHLSFDEAIDKLQVTENQFEFLVHSGVIVPRDNKKRSVTNKFDPDKHHVPIWEIERAKKALEEKLF